MRPIDGDAPVETIDRHIKTLKLCARAYESEILWVVIETWEHFMEDVKNEPTISLEDMTHD